MAHNWVWSGGTESDWKPYCGCQRHVLNFLILHDYKNEKNIFFLNIFISWIFVSKNFTHFASFHNIKIYFLITGKYVFISIFFKEETSIINFRNKSYISNKLYGVCRRVYFCEWFVSKLSSSFKIESSFLQFQFLHRLQVHQFPVVLNNSIKLNKKDQQEAIQTLCIQ